MCSSKHPASLFLTIIVLVGMSVIVSSRPASRSSRSSEDDILAGVDFLSIFMNSATESEQPTSSPQIASSSTSPDDDNPSTLHDDIFTTEIMRDMPDDDVDSFTEKTSGEFSFSSKKTSTEKVTFVTEYPSDINSSTEKAKRVTFVREYPGETNSLKKVVSLEKATIVRDNPSAIVSNSKRNEFNIEESEPLTINTNDKPEAKVKRKSEDLLAIGANPDYIAQQESRLHRENIPSYNHPYLNRQPGSRSRSVSYSAVIQSLPDPSKSWKDDKPNNQDYNIHNLGDYDYTESYPDYNTNQNKNLTSLSINSRHVDSTAESKDYYVTRKYNPTDFNESTDKNHPQPEPKRSFEPTERNWGLPEKNYEISNLPTVYGKPEENYEIDEAVSVMTNGRAHGVQNKATEKPLQPKVGQTPSKPDDNQKVGYVVEGRNYKKYRVEERTSDGFIVGEYGVVSNNDGSLRGVRYTADGTINPRVIYDALMKFLAL